ncbi:unnamed protein product (macronuclear) [Paramecium tetraurelia]|uniref:EGF-like domain-containing protein n=1 Tax=Paramecium tetraurelia TaxID=5888 RepID=A0DJW2_PARTE|nr:uncharacterized protein GSPATT00017673001 [Paramecium tetraurelia]CAK83329.1 unnamed protein product [Paramecium tetraurelia]|eukprot:XP_001450726.1 hypothetical protein (macronuclear) [Paramecium tetraurelia strain d4-2]
MRTLLYLIFYCSLNFAKAEQQSNLSNQNMTNLQWYPLRIYFQIIKQVEYNDKLVELLKQVSLYFEKTLLVRRNPEKIDVESIASKMALDQLDEEVFKEQTNEFDTLVFVGTKNMTDYKATCDSIHFDSITKRPNVCQLYLKNGLQFATTVFNHQKMLKTLIHETIHCLGLDKNVFQLFYNSSTGEVYKSVVSSNTTTEFLILSRSKEYLKFYFDCGDIQGIQLENQGQEATAGKHFENEIFLNDLMQGTHFDDIMITTLTLMFLQDTGFYQLAEHKTDQIYYGKHQGCDFLQRRCDNHQFTEFCQIENQKGCSFTNSGVGSCEKSKLSGECKNFLVIEDYNCKDPSQMKPGQKIIQHFGDDSICVQGSLSKQKYISNFSCQKFHCDVDNNMIITVGELSVNCSQFDKLYDNAYYGNITCPSNSQTICQNDNYCPNHCNEKGVCVNKECICTNGYSGKDCNIKCDGYRYQGECYEKCPSNLYTYESIKYCVGCPGVCYFVIVRIAKNVVPSITVHYVMITINQYQAFVILHTVISLCQ